MLNGTIPDMVVDSEHYVAALQDELARLNRERLLLLALTRQQAAQLAALTQAHDTTGDVSGAAAADSPP